QLGSTFYGMTSSGGTNNRGTIFSVNTDGSGVTVLHEFAGGVDDGRYPFGNLVQAGTTPYGATSQGGDNDRGAIFSINTDGSDYTLLYEFAGGADDGNYPQNIIIHDSTLYGLTEQGGNNDSGTVFSFSLGPTFTPTPTAMLQSK